MLVCYDENTGMINQCILQAQVTLEVLSERYAEAGIPHVLVESGDPNEILTSYVKDGQVIPRPIVSVEGNNTVKANGVDVLTLMTDPQNVKVEVLFGGATIHEETINDGSIEFSTDHAGTYTIFVSASFPYQDAILTVEAV